MQYTIRNIPPELDRAIKARAKQLGKSVNQVALEALSQAEGIFVPVIALGEIRSGFLGGRRAAANETRLQWFLAQDGVLTLGVDGPASRRYAGIHRALKERGTPVPTNDLWIAAMALEHGLVLYTRDAHFSKIPGLPCL